MSCLTKGAVGGDRGWEAAFVNFRLAVEMVSLFEDGEMMNTRKPIASSPANTNVIGLVRRKDLGRVIANVNEYHQSTRVNNEVPSSLVAPSASGVCVGYLIKALKPYQCRQQLW